MNRIADWFFEKLNNRKVRKLARQLDAARFLEHKHVKSLRDLNAAYLRVLVQNRRLKADAFRARTGSIAAPAPRELSAILSGRATRV